MDLKEFEQAAINIEEFEQAIINGQITDYRPYTENGTFHENRNRKQICIEYGVAQELYPEWAQSDDPDKYDNWIQLLLAENGYCLDILFESDDEEILSEVIKHNLNYTLLEDAVIMEDYRHLVYDALMDAKDIPFKVIEKYFETKDDDDDDSPLKLKYQAMQIEPTVIEKTMSPAQLYATDSPLWTNNYTGSTVERILKKLNGEPQTEESFNTVLTNINNKNNGRMMFDEYGNIGGVHGNRLKIGMSEKHKFQKIIQKGTK